MQKQAIAWYDHFESSRERTVYTFEQTRIPGLRTFGHHNTSHAIRALVPHYHQDCFEFSYLVQGNLHFSTNDHLYSLSGGDLFFTFPNEIHDTGNIPLSLHQMYWFQLDINNLDNFLFMDSSTAHRIVEKLYQLPNHVVKLNLATESIMEEIYAGIKSQTELGRIKAGTLIGVLLCQILECSDGPSFRLTPDIGRTMDFILQHIEEELEMEDLSRIALLSVSRFKQKFKSEVGISPRCFINFHKVEAAKRMLQEGRSVTETAMELSFSSSNYFSAVFRRYSSLSPTEYLEQLSKAPTEITSFSSY